MIMLSVKNMLNHVWPLLGPKEKETAGDFYLLCRKYCSWGHPPHDFMDIAFGRMQKELEEVQAKHSDFLKYAKTIKELLGNDHTLNFESAYNLAKESEIKDEL
jgi:heme/copper-type cytochrome/quinol oxidase subunit 2